MTLSVVDGPYFSYDTCQFMSLKIKPYLYLDGTLRNIMPLPIWLAPSFRTGEWYSSLWLDYEICKEAFSLTPAEINQKSNLC